MLVYKQPSSFENITFSIGVLEAIVYYKDVAMCTLLFPREVPSVEFKVSLLESIIEVLAVSYEGLLPALPFDDLGKNGFTFIDYSRDEYGGFVDELEDEDAWENSMNFTDYINEEYL